MKFLLYGYKGWIGQQMVGILKERKYDYVFGESRIDGKTSLEAEIRKINPTHIISTTGRTHGQIDGTLYNSIDYLEQPGKIKENVRDNLFGPTVLAIICQKYGIHLTYIGTGLMNTCLEKRSMDSLKMTNPIFLVQVTQ
jgi:dTDP-4-dehydrorhamnose reductase